MACDERGAQGNYPRPDDGEAQVEPYPGCLRSRPCGRTEGDVCQGSSDAGTGAEGQLLRRPPVKRIQQLVRSPSFRALLSLIMVFALGVIFNADGAFFSW